MAPELRIVPEPTADEREAVERVLAELGQPPQPYRSAWRRAGLLENVGVRELEAEASRPARPS